MRLLATLAALLSAPIALAQTLPSPSFTTPPVNDNSTRAATTGFVAGAVAGKAPLVSPTFTGTATLPVLALTGAPGTIKLGNQTSVNAVKMRFDWTLTDGVTPIEDVGNIWNTGKTYSYFGIHRTFDANTLPQATTDVPYNGAYIGIRNNGATTSAVALMVDARVTSANKTAFGANVIARSDAAANPKLVGMEIDVVPELGTFLQPGSAGLYLNVFNDSFQQANAIHVDAHASKWGNGLILANIVNAGVAPSAGTTLGSLINTGTATYTDDAIKVTNGHRVKLGPASAIYPSGDFLLFKSGASFVWRRQSDDGQVMSLDQSGALTVNNIVQTYSGTPSTSSSACTKGQQLYDASYFYVCVATNTWKRAALSTW